MKLYSFNFIFVDRKVGPKHQHIREHASSLPVALNKASRFFMKGKTRKERNDISTSGLKIEAVVVGEAEVQS